MALRRPSGVYARNSWDWLRTGNFGATVEASITGVAENTHLLNVGPSNSYVDLYRLVVFTSAANSVRIQIFQPLGLTTATITNSSIFPLDVANPAPNVSWGGSTSAQQVIATLQWESATNPNPSLELESGGPFYRLYQGQSIGFSFPAFSTAFVMTVQIFGQVISE